MNWREYETQVFQEFQKKYPEYEICLNQELPGRFSKVPRQIDILVKARITDVDMIGVFDCKCFSKNVDVKVIDSMFGFMDDLGAHFGGVVTTKGSSSGAKNRASAARIDLRVIKFASPETVIDEFVPKLDFSDPRNSMYIAII
ncbi:MAG: restriction endonuclease [Oscillatoriophycideae cyanobacterium NC_groundwater_1537_Pr4_S-0.65um_50_18]|nr:restriction endonuclease [Oscillatoriophycideae cyanobacterium NC_groundwater_1537_Pr4_S-0.65um_50_18]